MNGGPRGWHPSTAPELRELVERALVDWPKQLEVVRLKSWDIGWRRIGLVLGVDESTARRHFQRAERRIRAELAAQRGVQ